MQKMAFTPKMARAPMVRSAKVRLENSVNPFFFYLKETKQTNLRFQCTECQRFLIANEII